MGWRRYLPGVVLGLLVSAGVLVAPPPSAAADGADDAFTFSQPVGSRTSATVTVSFDRPVGPGAAAALGARIGAQIGAQPSARAGAAPVSGTSPTIERMTCGQQITRSDGDGGANLRYACFPQYAVLNWYFRLSPALQATAVGGIDERGLSWWRNSVGQPQNAPHPGVPPDYLLHGTMLKVWNGDVVDYQDYISWRHNIGSGGRISVVFAGSVALG